jgi:hypothetical protein
MGDAAGGGAFRIRQLRKISPQSLSDPAAQSVALRIAPARGHYGA